MWSAEDTLYILEESCTFSVNHNKKIIINRPALYDHSIITLIHIKGNVKGPHHWPSVGGIHMRPFCCTVCSLVLLDDVTTFVWIEQSSSKPGWELINQFPPSRYFSVLSPLSKHWLAIEYHVNNWNVFRSYAAATSTAYKSTSKNSSFF